MKLKDIAQLANVSTTTVSRVINGQGQCAREEVRRKIWKIVHESGYIPNSTARSLRASENTEQAHDTGNELTLSCIFSRIEDYCQDQFFSAIYDSIQYAAFQKKNVISGTRFPLQRYQIRICRSCFKA